MGNKFVFVIPIYNCQDDIHKTLYSLMSQSYDNWRAILINDISTDRTLDRIGETINNSLFYDKFTVIDNEEKQI